MWQIGSRTSSAWWCASGFTAKRQTTCPNCVRQSPKSPNDSTFKSSASRRLLVVPSTQLDAYGRYAYAMIGPTVWNALGNDPREDALVSAVFDALSALEALCDNAVYKLTLTLAFYSCYHWCCAGCISGWNGRPCQWARPTWSRRPVAVRTGKPSYSGGLSEH